MSKVVTSPVKRFSGTVVLSDPLTFPQSFAFEDALTEMKELGEGASIGRLNYAILPGVLACVEEWHLAGLDNPSLESFPSTPRMAVVELIGWLVREISALYQESDEIPLAS